MLTRYHVTTKSRHGSIVREGLCTDYDRKGLGRIWLCTRGMVAWAMLKLNRKRGVPLDGIVILRCRVKAKVLRRGVLPGLWFTRVGIPPERMEEVTSEVWRWVSLDK